MSTIMNKSKHVHGKPKYCLTCGVAGWLSERQASPATSCPFVCLSLRSASAVEASAVFVLSSQHLPSSIRSGYRCLVHFSVYSASALQALPVSVLYISPSTQHSRRSVVHLSIYSSFAVQTMPVSVSSCRTALRLPNTGGASLSLSPSTQHPWYQSLVLSHISPSTQHPRPVPVSCPVAHFSVCPTSVVPICLVAHSLSIYPTSVVPVCLVARSLSIYPTSVVPICLVAHSLSIYPTFVVPVCLVAHSLSIYPTSVVPVCLVARPLVYPASVVLPSPVSALYISPSTPYPLCEPGHFLPPSSARLIANRNMSALSRLVLTQSTWFCSVSGHADTCPAFLPDRPLHRPCVCMLARCTDPVNAC